MKFPNCVQYSGLTSRCGAPVHSIPRKNGFTIVELLIVIVVIAILAAITIVSYNGISQQARESAVKSALSSAAKQLGVYFTQDGYYPADAIDAGVTDPSASTSQAYAANDESFCLTYGVNGTFFSVTQDGSIFEGTCTVNLVTTVAGTGSGGFADGPGATAQFTFPYDIAVDTAGVLYVADFNNHRVRKVATNGEVSTLAGSSIGGYLDGTGTGARFDNPAGIAVNSAGTVYVADVYNHKIRQISPAGVVTTLAGGTGGYANGSGATARFNNPRGIAVDSTGTIYVADALNQRIRVITPSGTVSTLAGSGVAGYANGTGSAAQFAYPYGIAVDDAGVLYVADTNNHRIRKVTQAGVVTTMAGSGTAGDADGNGASAQFNAPYGIAVDDSGSVYVADTNNHRIRKISPSGEVTTIVGNGSGYAEGEGTAALFNTPRGLVVTPSGDVYVADANNHRLRKVEQ